MAIRLQRGEFIPYIFQKNRKYLLTYTHQAKGDCRDVGILRVPSRLTVNFFVIQGKIA